MKLNRKKKSPAALIRNTIRTRRMEKKDRTIYGEYVRPCVTEGGAA